MKKALTLICTLSLLACGHAGSSESAPSGSDSKPTAEQGTIKEGTFKMYEEARVSPVEFCDLHTILKLSNTDAGITASLSNSLSGYCEIAVFENLRSYNLTAVDTSCGSVTYEGVLTKPVNSKVASDKILLTDHRTRTCRDLVPAQIIVEQIYTEGKVTTLYSHDEIVEPSVTLKGALVRIAAIGGESTGFGLLLTSGEIIELALETTDLISSFEEDKDVVVTGVYKTVYGVEIPERQVLVVETMTAN